MHSFSGKEKELINVTPKQLLIYMALLRPREQAVMKTVLLKTKIKRNVPLVDKIRSGIPNVFRLFQSLGHFFSENWTIIEFF